MIQDIFPHIYHNEYHPHAPKDNDIVLVFDGNEVLLKTDDKIGEIIFFLMNNMLFLCIHRGFCEKNIIFAGSI